VDFKPFVSAIRTIHNSTRYLPNKDCDIPNSGIIFSYTNQHLFKFILLQYEAMEMGGHKDCLISRFLTVCLDGACSSLCVHHNITNCVYLDVPATPLVGFQGKKTEYGQYSYNYMTWLKYELLRAALMVCKQVFYFDADVVMFRNPWPEVNFGRDQQGRAVSGTYDIMYQKARGRDKLSCAGAVNGGLLYMRNSSELHERFFPKLYSHRERIILGTDKSDQDVVTGYVGLLRHCTLPVHKFAGHCRWSNIQSAVMKDLITFHASCAHGGHKERLLIRAIRSCNEDRTFGVIGLGG